MADKLLALLDQAGFDDLDVRDWRGEFLIGGGLPAAEAAHFALASSSVGGLLDEAGPEALDQARRALTERFSKHLQDGAVRMDACVHIVSGARLEPPSLRLSDGGYHAATRRTRNIESFIRFRLPKPTN
jgi:hypothetical protein